MKLSEFRKKSNEYTAKASEITRQLSLAGIAIIWLFKNVDDKQNIANITQSLFDKFLIIPLLTLTIALLVDLFQYVIAGQTWINFFRKKEIEFENSTEDPEIKAPEKLRIPIYVCYYTKIVLMLFSFLFIIFYIISKF